MKMEDRIKFVDCRIENSAVDAASKQRCVVDAVSVTGN
jgi:hypothetical protein